MTNLAYWLIYKAAGLDLRYQRRRNFVCNRTYHSPVECDSSIFPDIRGHHILPCLSPVKIKDTDIPGNMQSENLLYKREFRKVRN